MHRRNRVPQRHLPLNIDSARGPSYEIDTPRILSPSPFVVPSDTPTSRRTFVEETQARADDDSGTFKLEHGVRWTNPAGPANGTAHAAEAMQ